jgi:hypothetical protein
MPTWNCQVNLSYDDGRQQRERERHTHKRERAKKGLPYIYPPSTSFFFFFFFFFFLFFGKIKSWAAGTIRGYQKGLGSDSDDYYTLQAPACAMSSSIVEVPSRPVSDDMLPDRDDLWPTTRPFLLLSSVSIPPHVDAKSAPPSIPSSSSSFPLLKMRLERRRRRKKMI